MTQVVHCPACGLTDVEQALVVPAAPTSDSTLVKLPADTTVCRACGFAFNSSGARGRESEFYAESYDLLAESDEAEPVYETSSGARGLNEEMADYLFAHADIARGADVLDVGCGKGMLLRALHRARPDLRLSGVEPSRHAYQFGRRVAPTAELFHGTLENSPFANRRFAAIVSANVFEHVPDPVGFARDLSRCLLPGGRLFLCVPNFLNNPADVVTYDHLSRFTPTTLHAVLARAGFVLEHLCAGERVPMWALARMAQAGEAPGVLTDDGNAARRSAVWFQACIDVFKRLNRSGGRRIGVYGTGLLVPAAIALGALDVDGIAAFFDDNPHMHGAQRLGRKIYPLAAASELGIADMTFSANPVYLSGMLEKVKSLSADIRAWPLPALH